MTHRSNLYNLFSSYNLSDEGRDFLQRLKTREYEIRHPDFSEKIGIVNTSGFYQSVLKDSTLELGNVIKKYQMNDIENSDLFNIQFKRESTRSFEGFLPKEKLFELLQLTYFVKDDNTGFLKRNIASGGGTYPLEVFVLNTNIDGLEYGLYHYNIYNRTLDLVKEKTKDEVDRLVENIYSTQYKRDIDYHNASCFVFIKGFLNRTTFKYGDMGIKLAMIDTGALVQNAYLASSELGIKCCACAGYIDSYLDELLENNSSVQTTMCSLIFGK